jgi:hypothetical protein
MLACGWRDSLPCGSVRRAVAGVAMAVGGMCECPRMGDEMVYLHPQPLVCRRKGSNACVCVAGARFYSKGSVLVARAGFAVWVGESAGGLWRKGRRYCLRAVVSSHARSSRNMVVGCGQCRRGLEGGGQGVMAKRRMASDSSSACTLNSRTVGFQLPFRHRVTLSIVKCKPLTKCMRPGV